MTALIPLHIFVPRLRHELYSSKGFSLCQYKFSFFFSFLKEKVGVSLLKPANVAAFGRRLSNIPGLKKRETSSNSEYFVKRKKL